MSAGALLVVLILVLGLAWAGFCGLVRHERGHVMSLEWRIRKVTQDVAIHLSVSLEEASLAVQKAMASVNKLNAAFERKP